MSASVPIGNVAPAPAVFERSLHSCVEVVVASVRSGQLAPPWKAPTGAVWRPSAQTVALHFAPARWLLVDASTDLVASALAVGGNTADVEGKWRCFEIRGPRALTLLSAGINVAMILDGRDCAATSLFDCPTVIARSAPGDDFDVYVCASYASFLQAAFELALQRIARS